MCDLRFFKKAVDQYDLTKCIFLHAQNDERFLGNVSYNLQQSVEYALKSFLETHGVTVPRTHSISKLVKMCKDNGVPVIITEWLSNNAPLLSSWESESRYDMDFYVEVNNLKDALAQIKIFLDLNGLKYELREELKDSNVMAALMEYLPKNRKFTDLELNVFYQVYSKKLKTSSAIKRADSF